MNVRKVKPGCRSPNCEFCCHNPLAPACVWTSLQISAFKSTAYSFSTLLHLTCRVKLDDDNVAFSSPHNSLGFKVPVSWFRAKSYLHELYRCRVSFHSVSKVFVLIFAVAEKTFDRKVPSLEQKWTSGSLLLDKSSVVLQMKAQLFCLVLNFGCLETDWLKSEAW